jgi:hypothetical protein
MSANSFCDFRHAILSHSHSERESIDEDGCLDTIGQCTMSEKRLSFRFQPSAIRRTVARISLACAAASQI